MNNKKRYNLKIIIIIIIMLILAIFCYIKFGEKKIYKENVIVENSEILLISKREINKCFNDLIDYLNDNKFYNCKKIVFYNNTFDKRSNEKYFYALVKGNDASLIEIVNNGNESFSFNYIGNELTPNGESSITGVTYLQIIDPKEYLKQKELEIIREDDDKYIIDSIPKDTVIE